MTSSARPANVERLKGRSTVQLGPSSRHHRYVATVTDLVITVGTEPQRALALTESRGVVGFEDVILGVFSR